MTPSLSDEKQIEIIAWLKWDWQRHAYGYQTASEVSDPQGIFGFATASLTYETEDPAVSVGSSENVTLNRVRIANDDQKQRYLKLQEEIQKLRGQAKTLEQEITASGVPMTWEWILAHGKPRENGYIPIPHHSKTALANLRKGSRVVISTVSSRYYEIQGKVGKVVKKKSKDVDVQFGQTVWRIPYHDLKPAHDISAEKREENQRSAKILAEVAGQFNKVTKKLGW